MKKIAVIILLFISFCIYANEMDQLRDKFGDIEVEIVPSDDQAMPKQDIEKTDLDKSINEYKAKSVKVYSYQMRERFSDEGLQEKFADEEVYFLYRGNGTQTKISELMREMGATEFSKKIAIAENYNIYLGILIPSAIISAALDIFGVVSLVSGTTNLFSMSASPGVTEERLFALGIGLLAGSVLTIVPMIVFSALLGYSSKYKYNMNQAKALVNQYNRFLKERLKIPMDINISYNFKNKSTSFDLCFKF